MPRRSQPWWRASKQAWYVKIGGRQVRLGTDRTEADRAYHQLMLDRGQGVTAEARGPALLAGHICDLYHAHAVKHLAPVTSNRYREFLEGFAQHAGRVSAPEVRPKDVTAWIDARPGWGPTTRANAVAAVMRAFRWAAKQGHIDRDPLAGMERPRAKRREAIVDATGAARMLEAAISPAFRDLLELMRETGCRPGEAIRLEARHIDWERRLARLDGKTTGRTGRLRVIHLTERAMTVLAAGLEAHPTGPLLRNTRGQPWSRTAINCQMRRLRKRAGLVGDRGVVPYALRHLWITDALEAGAPIASVAELAGHTSTVMVARVYSHLSDRHDHLRSVLEQTRPTIAADAPRPGGPPGDGGSGRGD